MKCLIAILLAVCAVITAGIAAAETNYVYQNSNFPISIDSTGGNWNIQGSNEVKINSGHDNVIAQWTTSPIIGGGIYQNSVNKVEVTGSYNTVLQANYWSASNQFDTDTKDASGVIDQNLYNYALINGDRNTVVQENYAIAYIDANADDSSIFQTLTNLAYVGKTGTSNGNIMMQRNFAEAAIFGGVAGANGYGGEDLEIDQKLKNVGEQEGDNNQLYQGFLSDDATYNNLFGDSTHTRTFSSYFTPDVLSLLQTTDAFGANYASASIGYIPVYDSDGNLVSTTDAYRCNYDSIDQTQTNTAIQRGTSNLATQANWATADITEYDYNSISQSQKNSLTQDGNNNILNQGRASLTGESAAVASAGLSGANVASATITDSCKVQINQLQSSRGSQVGDYQDMMQGDFAEAYIHQSGWEYLTPAASIDQSQKLIGSQSGAHNVLIQGYSDASAGLSSDLANAAVADIQFSAGDSIYQTQKSLGGQGATNNLMTQSNVAIGSLHQGFDPDDIQAIDYDGDLVGNVIEQSQRNTGAQTYASSNKLTQTNKARATNYDGADDVWSNGLDDHAVQTQSNDARQSYISPALDQDIATNQIITQSNDAITYMLGMDDEISLTFSNAAVWKGLSTGGSLTQFVTATARDDTDRSDYMTDTIAITAKNIAQIKASLATSVVTGNDVSHTDNVGLENTYKQDYIWDAILSA